MCSINYCNIVNQPYYNQKKIVNHMRTAERNIRLLRNNVIGDSLVHLMIMLQKV